MRIVHSRRRLPRIWSNHPEARGLVVAETDIAITNGPLRAKLLVFRNRTALRQFWEKALNKSGHGEKLSLRCEGAVNSLMHKHRKVNADGSEKTWIEVDPRYFCIIGLVKGMSEFASAMEIVAHESMHAGFAYAKRVNRDGFWVKASGMDEEDVCYPAGRIARKINLFLAKRGLY